MIRRTRRSFTSSTVAVLILVVVAAAVTTAIQLLMNRTPLLDYTWLARQLNATTWGSPRVLSAAAVLAVLALVVLAKALLPGKRRVLPLRDDTDGVTTGLSRAGYANALRSAASVPSADSARVAVRGGSVTAVVRTSLGTPKEVAEDVRAAITERLATIGPAREPRVRVRVREQR
ncbi:hypothetical protein D5S17_15055 [Pseudonocardiaceae bacterium YIM PH 21723]|nr:hypothetical protein D5S17_15055 [Pseudonocardiaceae bacterium YIM PH 21723]